MAEKDVLERLRALEIELSHEREDRKESDAQLNGKVKELEAKLGYYDKMALRWGSFCIGFLTFGAVLWAGVDRLKEKVLSWFLP